MSGPPICSSPLSLRVNCRASQANHRRNLLVLRARNSSSRVISFQSCPVATPPPSSSLYSSPTCGHSNSTHPWSSRRRASTAHCSVPHTDPPAKLLSDHPILHPPRRQPNGPRGVRSQPLVNLLRSELPRMLPSRTTIGCAFPITLQNFSDPPSTISWIAPTAFASLGSPATRQ